MWRAKEIINPPTIASNRLDERLAAGSRIAPMREPKSLIIRGEPNCLLPVVSIPVGRDRLLFGARLEFHHNLSARYFHQVD